MPKGRETDGWAAFAAGARTGARPCDGREPAALSQCLCAARYYAAPHETHRMERDVRDAVGRGFPRAAAVYGAHGLSGAYRAAAGRALFCRTAAAAVRAVGRLFCACAAMLDFARPYLVDRNEYFRRAAGRGNHAAA